MINLGKPIWHSYIKQYNDAFFIIFELIEAAHQPLISKICWKF